MDWTLVTLGMQVLIAIAIGLGAWFNSKAFKYNRETFASQLFMITMLQDRVRALEELLTPREVSSEAKAEINKLWPGI